MFITKAYNWNYLFEHGPHVRIPGFHHENLHYFLHEPTSFVYVSQRHIA